MTSAWHIATVLLLLLAAGCKDTTITATGDFNGEWRGTTSLGGQAYFLVGDNKVINLAYNSVFPDCEIDTTWAGPFPIDGNTFEHIEDSVKLGHAELHGTFTSEDACVIRYLQRNWPRDRAKCPRDWEGTITVSKTR